MFIASSNPSSYIKIDRNCHLYALRNYLHSIPNYVGKYKSADVCFCHPKYFFNVI